MDLNAQLLPVPSQQGASEVHMHIGIQLFLPSQATSNQHEASSNGPESHAWVWDGSSEQHLCDRGEHTIPIPLQIS